MKDANGEWVIDDRFPWGHHIPLTCENHPELRWSTKNIDVIGARSLFYISKTPECSCSGRDLRILNEEEYRALAT